MIKNRKDSAQDIKNEGVGIFTLIILVFLAVIGIYFLYTHQHPAKPTKHVVKIPMESPGPILEPGPVIERK